MQCTNLKDGLFDFILGNDSTFFLNSGKIDYLQTFVDILKYASKILGLNYVEINSDKFNNSYKRNSFEVDPNKVYLVRAVYPTLEEYYSYRIITKKYKNIKFFFNYDLNKLNYYFLNNLEVFDLFRKCNSYYSEENLKEFNSFEDFISYAEEEFIVISVDNFLKEIRNHIVKNKISIEEFCYYNFIALNEDDCANWHKFICKEIFNIPYTDFTKIYFKFFRYHHWEECSIQMQSENYIYLNSSYSHTYYDLSKKCLFKRRDAYDEELKQLFKYSSLDTIFIPKYINILEPYTDMAYFIGMNQLKEFYYKYPNYFKYLIYTLRCFKYKPVTIIK